MLQLAPRKSSLARVRSVHFSRTWACARSRKCAVHVNHTAVYDTTTELYQYTVYSVLYVLKIQAGPARELKMGSANSQR